MDPILVLKNPVSTSTRDLLKIHLRMETKVPRKFIIYSVNHKQLEITYKSMFVGMFPITPLLSKH
jgi:hypothetical protein